MELARKDPDTRDHRSIMAEKKRSEMRARILRAALEVCAADLRELPTIEAVADKAGISRGTFYNYFESVEAALAALGQDITRLALLEGERFRCVFKEKWKSTSVVLRVVLTRALLDRPWASFVLRTRAWRDDPLLGAIVLQDLAEGRQTGEYAIQNDQVALDFLRGLLESCVTALHQGVDDPDAYITAAIHMWLQALGCSAALCTEGARMSKQFLSDYLASEHKPFFGPDGAVA
ncbi:MAG: TetR/AcrR family transcriptional regulator [Ramlibacter sp.]